MSFKTVRSYLMAKSYDFLMRGTEQRCLDSWRQEVLASAHGAILEIGSGTGVNLPYLTTRNGPIYLCEPDKQMRKQLSRKILKTNNLCLQVTPWAAEKIDLPDESIDTVVSTLVLCSVKCLSTSLKEAYRLLRPGGTLIFMEHIASDHPKTRLWQQRLEPLWGLCAGECRLTRDTVIAIEESGFQIEQLTEDKMCGAPEFVNRTVRGLARKNPAQAM